MLVGRRRPATLHLQLGQEIIYLIMTVGIVLSIVLGLYLLVTLRVDQPDVASIEQALAREKQRSSALERRLAEAERAAAKAMQEREQAEARAAEAEKVLAAQRAHDQPPIIVLSEAEGYSFPSGRATIATSFRRQLSEIIVPRIVEIGEAYDAHVIEVVGHTDEVPVVRSRSTLDSELLEFLHATSGVQPLVTDNVGLGMLRAAAVARILARDPRLRDYIVLPLSAGQVVLPDHRLAPLDGRAEDDPRRRRIEIRLRRTFEISATSAQR